MKKDKGQLDDLFMLRVYAGKLIPILEIFCSGYAINKADLNKLDDVYRQLYKRIQGILRRDQLANYRKNFPEVYDSLNVLPEDMARMWHFGKEQMMHFINLVEAVWKVEGNGRLETNLKIDDKTKDLLSRTDQLILELSKGIDAQMQLEQARQTKAGSLDEFMQIWPSREEHTASRSKLKLEAKSYDAANGILNFYGEKIYIIRQANMRGVDLEKNPAKLMRYLFAVNTFPGAVPIRKIFPVNGETYPPNVIKSANTLVARINGYIQEKTPAEVVINHNKFSFYIEKQYLN